MATEGEIRPLLSLAWRARAPAFESATEDQGLVLLFRQDQLALRDSEQLAWCRSKRATRFSILCCLAYGYSLI